jgi:type II secretory pathway pseudopilin PulG
MRFPLRRQAGTTLIEPLVATAVIGALAAAVLPQFAELGGTAQATQLQGVAAAATSAMHANQGACLVSAHAARTGGCVPVDNCAAVGRLLFGGLPAGYAVTDQPLGPRNGVEATCTVTQLEGGLSERFAAVSAGL